MESNNKTNGALDPIVKLEMYAVISDKENFMNKDLTAMNLLETLVHSDIKYAYGLKITDANKYNGNYKEVLEKLVKGEYTLTEHLIDAFRHWAGDHLSISDFGSAFSGDNEIDLVSDIDKTIRDYFKLLE